jgi:hypothetical protein
MVICAPAMVICAPATVICAPATVICAPAMVICAGGFFSSYFCAILSRHDALGARAREFARRTSPLSTDLNPAQKLFTRTRPNCGNPGFCGVGARHVSRIVPSGWGTLPTNAPFAFQEGKVFANST